MVFKEVVHDRPQKKQLGFIDDTYENSVDQDDEPVKKKPIKEGKIPDMSILKMLETSMEEMIRFEVNLT